MPTINGVTCSISTTNGNLSEYWEPDDPAVFLSPTNRKLESCYIQSHEDLEFTISVQTDSSFPSIHGDATHLNARFKFDGITQKPYNSLARVGLVRTYEGFYDPQRPDCYRTMTFAKLDVTEEKVPGAEQGGMQELGEIQVMLWRYKRNGNRKTTKTMPLGKGNVKVHKETEPAMEVAPRQVHEKALKGRDVSHVVGAGRVKKVPQPTSTSTSSSGRYVDPIDGEPYMTFRFLYRSERALKSLGFNIHSLTPLAATSPQAELFALPHEQLVARILELQAQQTPAVKRERGESVEVKAEGGSVKRKRIAGIMTIDLTDD